MPLFIDTFGTAGSKPKWMGFMLMSPPLGIMLGYAITAICLSWTDSWRFAFFVLSCLAGTTVGLILLVPNDLINIDGVDTRLKHETDLPDTDILEDTESSEELKQEPISRGIAFKRLMSNVSFVAVLMGTTGLFFIISGI